MDVSENRDLGCIYGGVFVVFIDAVSCLFFLVVTNLLLEVRSVIRRLRYSMLK